MAVLVALLRGINVGAHKRMKMDALRQVFVNVGLKEPETYLQSGNVVFHTAERDLDQLAKSIEAGIQKAFGFHSDVILRSTPEMRQVSAANPFGARPAADPAKLAVIFLKRPLSPVEQEALEALDPDPEELSIVGSEIFIYYPNGMGRSKLNSAMDKVLKVSGTARNWRSVTNVLERMTAMESGGG